MRADDLKLARELKKRLAELVPIVDLRLFGSRARGEGEEDSDLDVFIEVEGIDPQLKRDIRKVVWEVGFQGSVCISPLIFTRYEIEETPLRSAPIVKNIMEEGIPV